MRTTRLLALGALAILPLVGPLAPAATAEVPEDDPAASAMPIPTTRGTHLENVESELPWDNPPYRPCAGVDGSRDVVVDVILHYCDTNGQGWIDWDINYLYRNTAGTPIYEIKNPYTGYCLSLEGVESGASVKPDNGHDAQQEPCERQHDARWWFSRDGHGHILIRPYLKNSAGRYPCLEADSTDPGDITVQIWDCPTSRQREWVLRDSSGRIYT